MMQNGKLKKSWLQILISNSVKAAQQAHAGDAPSKVFIEVDCATLSES